LENNQVNIILFGAPGSGKGTQGDKLAKEFRLIKISSGDLLREEIKKDTSLGKEIKLIIDKGSLVSDDIINKLIEVIISKKSYHNRLIFDGYPRNINQVENLSNLLKKYNQKMSSVISLNVSIDIITKRILGREICSKCNLIFNKFFYPATKENHKCEAKYLKTRSDDNEETIKLRYKTYNEQTQPIIKYYKNQNLLHEIDGMKEIDVIYEEIRAFISSLDT